MLKKFKIDNIFKTNEKANDNRLINNKSIIDNQSIINNKTLIDPKSILDGKSIIKNELKIDTENGDSPQFWASDSFSVQTTRQFGLLRGKPITEALKILHAENERRRRRPSDDSGIDVVSPPPEDETDIVSANNQKNAQQHAEVPKTTNAPKFGGKGKSHYDWHWPLGMAKIKNNDDQFEVKLPIGSFLPDEVWAVIVGNGLTIRCDATNRSDSEKLKNEPGKNRYLLRMYNLPLNVDPRTAEFSIVNKQFCLKLTKDKPLKLAVATFGPDEGTD